MDKHRIDERVAALEREVARLRNRIPGTNGLNPAQIEIVRYLLERPSRESVSTMFFADLLNSNRKTVWSYLSRLEASEYVYRRGPKSGWIATGKPLPDSR